MVIMAFDEQGQADTYQRKIDICKRSFDILTEQANINPRDIIFDPNIFAIGTGIEEHDNYAVDFIQAVEWIHKHLPGVSTSGGLSNVSFAFRGNNFVREAIHTVFLYHAIRAGLTMAIVNAGQLGIYDDLPEDVREAAEDRTTGALTLPNACLPWPIITVPALPRRSYRTILGAS